MSGSSRTWTIDRRSLGDALDRWLDRGPSHAERALISEFLMDLTIDPFLRGREDDDSGIWMGRAGPVLIVYIPDRDRRIVSVIDINHV